MMVRGTQNSIQARIQEKVGPAWTTRNSVSKSGSGSTLSQSVATNCAGHGTESWRGQGYGKDSRGDTRTTNSSAATITC